VIGDGEMEILPRPVNLTNAADVREMAALIDWNGYGLVVFDSLARCMVGADENSAKDCGQVVDALHRLCERTPKRRGVILPVHHTGKDGKTFRGSSVFEAGADTVYAVTKDGAVIILDREKAPSHPAVKSIGCSYSTQTRACTTCWRPSPTKRQSHCLKSGTPQRNPTHNSHPTACRTGSTDLR
jgi:hypothetical protein